jgi:hypothetical protein
MSLDDWLEWVKSVTKGVKAETTIAKPETSAVTTHEPPPVKNDEPPIAPMVREDLVERALEGEKRYGTPLQPFNGRDALVDAYQETMDAPQYVRQAMYERSVFRKTFASVVNTALGEAWANRDNYIHAYNTLMESLFKDRAFCVMMGVKSYSDWLRKVER